MREIIVILSLIFSFGIYAQKKSEDSKRPNIIFILSDDHATSAITAYDKRFEKIAPTPNIDKIAKEHSAPMLFVDQVELLLLQENTVMLISIIKIIREAILTEANGHSQKPCKTVAIKPHW